MKYLKKFNESHNLPMVRINGLTQKQAATIMDFILSKINDVNFIKEVERGGNNCNIDWIKDGMNISNDDMIHIIFELYGIERESTSGLITYTLNISGLNFHTTKIDGEWEDIYYVTY